MGRFSTTGKNEMLDGITPNLISLHAAHPGADGLSNEVTGGSPAYARQTAVINAAGSGERALNADVAFDVPAGDVAVIAFWEDLATDKFLGWAPNGPAANNPQAAYAEATSNEIRNDGHGLSDDERVFVYSFADALPAGLSETVLYYVISSDADSFQVSLTSGGAAVAITADGDMLYQKCIVETFAQQGTFNVKTGTKLKL